MQLRLLTTLSERDVFLTRLDQARAQHASGFRENAHCHSINQRRLECSQLYGLFQNESAPADTMIAGVAMHDLRSFPQSCDEPDLSYLPPETVVECSDHWSLSNGAGMAAWAGLAVPMRLQGIRAALAYLAAENEDCAHAGFYQLMGFVPVGPLVAHPFVENDRAEKLLVQPVLLEGDAFNHTTEVFSMACSQYSDDARVFELKSMRPLMRHFSGRKSASASVPANLHIRGGIEAVELTA